MRIFTINSRVKDGKPVTSAITASLNIAEINYIRCLCEKQKISNNEVEESIRQDLIEQLKPLES